MKTFLILIAVCFLCFWAFHRLDQARIDMMIQQEEISATNPESSYNVSASFIERKLQPILGFSFGLVVETILLTAGVALIICFAMFLDLPNKS